MTTALTVPTVTADFGAWHREYEWAAVWAITLDGPATRGLMSTARSALAEWLLPRYERRPHVTVGYVGLLADDRRHPGGTIDGEPPPYSPADLASDVHRLRSLLPGQLRLSATGWDTVEMVPFLGVQHPWLPAAHDLLTRGEGPRPFRPHVTVGQYAVAVPLDAVRARLAHLPSPAGHTWTVPGLHLLRFATRDVAGPLYEEGHIDLRTGAWRWSPDAVLRGDAPAALSCETAATCCDGGCGAGGPGRPRKD